MFLWWEDKRMRRTSFHIINNFVQHKNNACIFAFWTFANELRHLAIIAVFLRFYTPFTCMQVGLRKSYRIKAHKYLSMYTTNYDMHMRPIRFNALAKISCWMQRHHLNSHLLNLHTHTERETNTSEILIIFNYIRHVGIDGCEQFLSSDQKNQQINFHAH